MLSYNDGKAAFLKNGYKSVIARIDITFTCHFVCYMVAVSTCNKDDVRCKKHNEQWWVLCSTYTPKEGIEQHRKQEYLQTTVRKSKLYLLGDKKQWTHGRVDKASGKTIYEVYPEYKQGELNQEGEKIENTLGKHVISLYSSGISQVVKIRDLKKLQ